METYLFGEVPLDSLDSEGFSNAYVLLPYAEYLFKTTRYCDMIFTQEASLTRKWFSGRSCIQSNWNKLGVNFEEGGNP